MGLQARRQGFRAPKTVQLKIRDSDRQVPQKGAFVVERDLCGDSKRPELGDHCADAALWLHGFGSCGEPRIQGLGVLAVRRRPYYGSGACMKKDGAWNRTHSSWMF